MAPVRFSFQDLNILEEFYIYQPYPTQQERSDLGTRLAKPVKSISVWFAGRRRKQVKDGDDLSLLSQPLMKINEVNSRLPGRRRKLGQSPVQRPMVPSEFQTTHGTQRIPKTPIILHDIPSDDIRRILNMGCSSSIADSDSDDDEIDVLTIDKQTERKMAFFDNDWIKRENMKPSFLLLDSDEEDSDDSTNYSTSVLPATFQSTNTNSYVAQNPKPTMPKPHFWPTPPNALSGVHPLQHPSRLPELPDGVLDEKIIAQVKDIWSRGSAGDVVGQFERNECTRGDLRTLKGTNIFDGKGTF